MLPPIMCQPQVCNASFRTEKTFIYVSSQQDRTCKGKFSAYLEYTFEDLRKAARMRINLRDCVTKILYPCLKGKINPFKVQVCASLSCLVTDLTSGSSHLTAVRKDNGVERRPELGFLIASLSRLGSSTLCALDFC